MFGQKNETGSPQHSCNGKSETSQQVYEKAIDWETSRIFTIEQSERRAWQIAIGATVITVLSWIALVLLLPLKETVPFVIRVDKTTGVPDIVTTMHDKEVNGDEIMDKYWLAQYVRARETYDWYTLQKDYDRVGLLSSLNVGQAYADLFKGKDALDKKYGANVRSTIDIISVIPTGKNTGTVRFIKTTKNVNGEGPGISTKWVATIAYEYRNPSVMKESMRLINPFGFQVLSYRVDPELVGSTQQ